MTFLCRMVFSSMRHWSTAVDPCCDGFKWLGTEVAVLPLARIYASKKFVGRPKDLAHLPVLEQTMKLQRLLRRRKKP